MRSGCWRIATRASHEPYKSHALLRGNAFSDETVMTHRIPLCIALLSLLAMTSSAVAQFTVASGQQVTPAPTLERGAELPLLTVHKHPSCGCCGVWADHMRRAGFNVVEKNVEDMATIKAAAGVPSSMGSCHTAQVGDYFVEGHVPAEDIRRLLRERPDTRGLAVPGMPIGSPGMESPDGRRDAFTVTLLGKDGTLQPYARHP